MNTLTTTSLVFYGAASTRGGLERTP